MAGTLWIDRPQRPLRSSCGRVGALEPNMTAGPFASQPRAAPQPDLDGGR